MLRRPSKFRPSPALVLACVAVLLAAGGVATGATGSGSQNARKIVACADQDTGVLRIATKDHCPKDARRVAWKLNGSPGPAGPQGENGLDGVDGQPGSDGADGADGAAGSALAYAHVNPDATLDTARSKNVTSVTKLSGASAGVYCLEVAVPVANVVATLDGNVADDVSVRPIIRASLTSAAGCPPGTDVSVRIVDETASVSKPFFVALN
jgi:hypothetical protein